ncbi:ATP-binding cassette glutathione S-conjugate transporter ycf1, partial [Coemansia helicoidea]
MAAQVHVLAVLGLPVLAQHPVGSIAFQLASLAGAHRAIYGGSGPWQAGTAAALHAALVAANLDPQSRATLGVLATKLLLVQEIHLIRLSRLRTLTLDDIWPLPERYRMDAIRHEFHYNIDEPLFLVRAALRMVWRPLLPLVIVDSMLQMLDVVAIVAEARMLRCLDSPADYPWYQGYLAALTVCLVRLVQELHPRVKDHIAAEVGRVRRAVELELFRIPLTRGNTDAQVPYYSGYFVDFLGHSIRNVTNLVSDIAVACASIATVYGIIGPLVLIPVVVCAMVMLANDGFEALVGPIWNWQRGYRGRYDGTVDSIYHNIKAIKLFGWERMFTDPELCYRETDGELLPWYAPAVVFAWWAIHTVNNLITQLSAYAVVYIYTQRGAFRTLFATDADMFRLNNHIRDIILHLRWMWYRMQNLRRFFAENFDVERRMARKPGLRLSQSAAASKTGSAVDMCDCSFVWSKWARKPVLTNVSLSASSGELVAVVGKTGSGKSSLLLAICGELEMTAGTGGLVGTVGYLEQSPWIMCATLRANILFGREYDAAFLAKVIYACALADDIAQWPDGDLAVIGERGINLSGGQRARLALARTLYSRADIYILDDPLSAVDAHVKRHILDHVLLDSGMLAGKLRVVATHVHQILPFAHQVVRLDDGRATVTAQCPQAYSPAADPQLLSSGYLSESSTTTAVNTAPPSPT